MKKTTTKTTTTTKTANNKTTTNTTTIKKITYDKTNEEVKFENVKDDVKNVIEESLSNHLKGDYVEEEQQQKLKDTINEINQKLHSDYPGYKFVVTGTTFKKGRSGLNTSSGAFWNVNDDGSVMGKYEDENQHAFVSVYGVSY